VLCHLEIQPGYFLEIHLLIKQNYTRLNTEYCSSSDIQHVRTNEPMVLSGLRPWEWCESYPVGPTHWLWRATMLLVALTLQLVLRTKLTYAGDRTSLRLA